jgi:hypothetical protein
MNLSDLADLLRGYATGTITLDSVHERLRPLLAADPLDVSASDSRRWLTGHDDERLFWRLVYLAESGDEDTPRFRDRMRRIIASLDRTWSAATTHELLPLVIDQPRFCIIVRKYRAGHVSRVGFLSVIAESGYPGHVKLWLQHASPTTLETLCERLEADGYDAVAAAFEAPPA